MPSGKCSLKWDITTHLKEWPKQRILTITNAVEYVEPQKLSFIATEIKIVQPLWKSLAVSYKINIHLPNDPTVVFLDIYPGVEWVENSRSHKILYTDVYRSIIHNLPNFEVTRMSFSRWMDKIFHCLLALQCHKFMKCIEES